MLFDSAFVLDGVRRTKDGYLAAYANVARTGIQRYKGAELGRPDLDDVMVYRPADEVFNKDALKSMAHRPVTLNHPSEVVDAKNWKKYAKGHTGDEILRDGDHVRVPMVLMDAEAIKAVERGTRELSMGYSTELKWTPGMTADGQRYDAVQTEIRANHLALVPVARGGSNLRFGDADPNQPNVKGNKMKTIMIDGAPVEIADELAATLISNKIKTLSDAFEFAKKEKDEAEEEEKKSKQACDAAAGEIAVLKKQLADAEVTPEKLDVLVNERASVIDGASKLLDSGYDFKGKTLSDIKHAAVSAHLGDAVVKTMNEDTVNGAFITLTADNAKGGTRKLADSLQRSGSAAPNSSEKDAAYQANLKFLGDAWRNPARA
jgi:hypothetical protein